jgi:hypothetical protein
MTNFEQAVAQAKEGKLKTPSVSYGGEKMDYFGYQLASHKFTLNVLSSGLKMRGVKLKDIKDYYGLKGKTAKECLEQFNIIQENYRASL